eukprot:1365563-Rhodomonas_salina.1
MRALHHTMCIRVYSCVTELAFCVPGPSVIPGHNCSCWEAKAASLKQVPDRLLWKSLVLENSTQNFPAIALT